MPHQSSAPPGTPFFARIDAFHCECPQCGRILFAHLATALSGRPPETIARLKSKRTLYNPVASVLYCPRCRCNFGVGLILWPLTRAGGIPADHVPNRRQLAELRQYARGIWAKESKRSTDELNIAVDAECTCPREAGGWAEGCPVHGWDTDSAGQDAPETIAVPDPEGEPGDD